MGEADLLTIVGIAGAAAIASPIGRSGCALGYAHDALHVVCTRVRERCPARHGRLLDAPEALRLTSPPIAVGGFSTGFLAMYAFDLFIHRGQLAGKEAEERPQVERFYTKASRGVAK